MFGLFKKKSIVLAAPATGKAVPLSQVSDPTFGEKMLGDGYAVIPDEGEIYSPISGKISMVFDTGHAVGITADDGVEILVHVGLDTVNMKGDGFETHVKTGDKVEIGTHLISVDLEKVKAAGYDTITPIIITDQRDYKLEGSSKCGDVTHGDEIWSLTK